MKNASVTRSFILLGSFILGTYAFGQIGNTEPEARPLVVSRHAHANHGVGSARLIIHRIPSLGNGVVVNLWIDGVAAGPIGYGHTYVGSISSGHHVLTVLPSPRAAWRVPTQIPLDVRSGETYNLTAQGDHSGHLILTGGSLGVQVR